MNEEKRKNLEDSIKALGDEDFSHPCSGYRTKLYLDPEECGVYVFSVVGAGVPGRAWHNIDVPICTIPADAIPGSVVSAVLGMRDYLENLCDNFRGTDWNGSNHVGVWCDDDHQYWDQPDLEITCYWDPGDWFEPVLADIKELSKTRTAEEIVDEIGTGDEMTGEVDRAKAIEFVEEFIAEFASTYDDGEVD